MSMFDDVQLQLQGFEKLAVVTTQIAFPSFEKFRASCEIKSKTSAFSCLSLGQQQNPVVNTVSNQNGN